MRKIEYYINILHYSIYWQIKKFNFLLLGIPDVAAGRILLILSLILGCSSFILVEYLTYDKLNDLIIFVFIIVCGGLVYSLSLYDNKYLIYFKEFEKKSKEWKRKWALLSFFTIIGIILFFVLSFRVMYQMC